MLAEWPACFRAVCSVTARQLEARVRVQGFDTSIPVRVVVLMMEM